MQLHLKPSVSAFCRRAAVLLLALLTVYAFSVQITVGNLFNGLPEKSIAYTVVFGVCLFLNHKILLKKDKPFQPGAAVLAGIFSLFMVFAQSFISLGNWSFIFHDLRQFACALLVIVGYAVFFYAALKGLFGWLDRGVHCQGIPFRETHAAAVWIRRHMFLVAFVVICIGWLPYLIIFYPGSVPHDGYNQLNQYFEIWDKSNAHPYFSTLFMGFFVQIGRYVSDNFGVFVFVLVQSLICAAAYALVCKKIAGWALPLWAPIAAMAFYALVPMWGAYAQALIKDTLYYAFFTLFVVYTIEIYQKRDAVSWLSVLLLALFGLLTSLFRNNGIYMMIPAGLFLLLVVRSTGKLKVGAALLGCLLPFLGFTQLMLPLLEVEEGSIREAMSIPFQQTARFVRDYPDEVLPHEKEAIAKVLDYDKLGTLYNPLASDPVKFSSQNDDPEDLKAYLKVWAGMFFRHPGTYVQALVNNTFAYYYPFYNENIMRAYQLYIKGPPVSTGDLDIHYVHGQAIRDKAASYSENWRQFPVVSLLSNPGAYTWAILILLTWMLHRKKRAALTVLLMPLFNLIVCVASPVNGLLRYAMPLMACMPLMIAFCLHETGVFRPETAEVAESVAVQE